MKAPAPALALLAALLLAFVSLPASAKGPRVEGLQASFEAGQVFVSFRLEGAFERADIREAVQSTQPLVFTFTVEVTKKRTAWKNKTLGRRVLLRRITYDTLTRQYTVETTLDGETTGSVTVSSYDDLAGAVGRVDHLAVCSVADMAPDASYEARAKVKLLDDFTLWIIPWDLETPWREEALLTP
jgi:hypothetical protein